MNASPTPTTLSASASPPQHWSVAAASAASPDSDSPAEKKLAALYRSYVAKFGEPSTSAPATPPSEEQISHALRIRLAHLQYVNEVGDKTLASLRSERPLPSIEPRERADAARGSRALGQDQRKSKPLVTVRARQSAQAAPGGRDELPRRSVPVGSRVGPNAFLNRSQNRGDVVNQLRDLYAIRDAPASSYPPKRTPSVPVPVQRANILKNGKVVGLVDRYLGGPKPLAGPRAAPLRGAGAIGFGEMGIRSSSVERSITAPLSVGYSIGPSMTVEHETYGRTGRSLNVRGHAFLAQVGSQVTLSIGDKLTVMVLSPAAIGGVPSVEDLVFDQFRVNKCRVHYVPVVSASTNGGIAIYFRNDMGNLIDTGEDEFKHSQTCPAFVETPVWSAVSLDVTPSNTNIRYVDAGGASESNVPAAQGIIIVEAASQIAAGQLGNLMIEYDIDFFGQHLDFEAADNPVEVLTTYTRANNAGAGDIIFAWTNAAGGADGANSALFSAAVNPSRYVWYGVLETLAVTGTADSIGQLGLAQVWALRPGQAYFFRYVDPTFQNTAGNGSWMMFLTLEDALASSANSGVGIAGSDSHSCLVFGAAINNTNAGQGVQTATYRLRSIPLANLL